MPKTGFKHSEESKDKISKALLGNKYTLGYKHTELAKEKISKALKGRISNRKGCKMSEEQKRKLSDALKGKKPYIMTEETKKKMSELAKKRIGEKSSRWKGGYSNSYRNKTAPRPKPEHCEICGRTGQICFDHDHKTGKFRGWICLKCNSALGMVEDKPEILIEMIKYINNK